MNIGKDAFKIKVCEALFGCFLFPVIEEDGTRSYKCACCEKKIDIRKWVHANHEEDCIINDVRDYLALYNPWATSSHGKKWKSRFKRS